MKDKWLQKNVNRLLQEKDKHFSNSLLVELFFCLFFFCWLFIFDSGSVSQNYLSSLFGPYIDFNPTIPLLLLSFGTLIATIVYNSLQINKTALLFLIRIPLYFIPIFFVSGNFQWGVAFAIIQTAIAFYLGYSYKGNLKRIMPILIGASLILCFEIFLIVIVKMPLIHSLDDLKFCMKLPFGQTNYLALYLIVFVVLTNVFYRDTKRKKLLLGYNVAVFLAIVLTVSRSALIVLAIYYLIEAVLYFKHHKFKKQYFYVLGGLVLAVGIFALIKWDTFYSLITRFSFEALAGNRIKVYSDVLEMIKENPWFGRSAFAYKAFDSVRAHSFILESLVQTGIVGTVLYLAILSVVFFNLVRIQNKKARTTLIVFFAITLLHGLVEPNLFSVWSDTFVWFLFGIGCALPKKRTKKQLAQIKAEETEPFPENVKISLCMCTYNGEQYIREQLDSIVNQTLPPHEIVVFDDASTDSTVAILNEYREKYPAIAWDIHVNEANAGWRVNFKRCLEKATGDVIFLADQDDIWVENKLSVMSRVLIKNDHIQVLVSDYTPFYMDGAIDKNIDLETNDTRKVSPIKPGKKLLYCKRPGCTFAVKKEILPEFFACWQNNFAHDALLWQIASLKYALYHIDYSSIYFRRHSSNASSNKNTRISAAERANAYKVLLMYVDSVQKLQNLTLAEQETQLLQSTKAWLNQRVELYDKPSLLKWIALCKKIGYYHSAKSYVKDLNPVLYKS